MHCNAQKNVQTCVSFFKHSANVRAATQRGPYIDSRLNSAMQLVHVYGKSVEKRSGGGKWLWINQNNLLGWENRVGLHAIGVFFALN